MGRHGSNNFKTLLLQWFSFFSPEYSTWQSPQRLPIGVFQFLFEILKLNFVPKGEMKKKAIIS